MKHSQYFLTVLAGFLASASATHVYLHPPASSSLTNKPNLLLAQYLSLERFHSLDSNDLTENLEAYSQGLGNFVGKGLENVVLLGVGEEEIADILPESLSQALTVDTSATSMFSQYLQQAESVYTDVSRSPSLSSSPSQHSTEGVPRILDAFTLSPTPESEAFLADLTSLVKFSDEVIDYDTKSSSYFGAFDISRSLHALSSKLGRESEQYTQATQIIRMMLDATTKVSNLKTAVISVPKNEVTKSHITKRAHSKRQQSPLPPPLPHPAHPIGAVSTCYQTLDSCTNSTSSCSGHGSCISASKAGRTCFVCACEASKIETGKGTGTNGKKTIYWAGDKCERQDVSGDFVLLAGSVIGLIVLVVGSVGLLAGVGSIELPSVLTGGALTSSKRE